MRNRIFIGYVLLLFVIGLFWRSSYKADSALRATFAKPDPAVEHHSVGSAKKEIDYLRATQSDLILLQHEAHARHTQAAIFTLLASTFILIATLRRPKDVSKSVTSP